MSHHYRVADGRRSIVLVVFIGGVTFAEISALRYLASKVICKLQEFILSDTLFCSLLFFLNPTTIASFSGRNGL